MDGTKIDEPVVQGKDNWEYVNKNAEGEYSLTGAIFMDSENNPDFQDFNTILYGHNMVPNVMFGSIKEFKEQAFYEAHPYGNLFVQNRNFGLEIIALIEADAYDCSVFYINVTRNDSIPYLEVIRNHAVYMNDITLEADDRILLLSTCSSESTNGRDILVARITDQTYKDTYSAKDQDHAGHESVDRRGGWRDFIPGWKTALFLVLLLLILICFADQWICRRRRKGRK